MVAGEGQHRKVTHADVRIVTGTQVSHTHRLELCFPLGFCLGSFSTLLFSAHCLCFHLQTTKYHHRHKNRIRVQIHT